MTPDTPISEPLWLPEIDSFLGEPESVVWALAVVQVLDQRRQGFTVRLVEPAAKERLDTALEVQSSLKRGGESAAI